MEILRFLSVNKLFGKETTFADLIGFFRQRTNQAGLSSAFFTDVSLFQVSSSFCFQLNIVETISEESEILFRRVQHIDAVYERPQDGNIVFFSGN